MPGRVATGGRGERGNSMVRRVLIDPRDLARFAPVDTSADQARALLLQQQETWDLLRVGYASLADVRVRVFEIDGFRVTVQFNPGRMMSTAAKVDDESIRGRRCFLCVQHLPASQRGLAYGEEFLVLCNPFPIFPEHFTITHRGHVPQQIGGRFGTLLALSRDLGSRYTVFYNGPRCGASAPDHMHFQAGTKLFMPLDVEGEQMRSAAGVRVLDSPALRAYAVENSRGHFVVLESADMQPLLAAFDAWQSAFGEITAGTEEPMMNIIVVFEAGWRVVLFPRRKHRPSFFFLEGDERILISPAAVDLGGVCITPLERDFERITREHLVEMFREICLDQSEFRRLVAGLTERLGAASLT